MKTTYPITSIWLQTHQAAKFARLRSMQHTSTNKVFSIRVHAIEDAPFEALEDAAGRYGRDVLAREDALGFAGPRTTDLLPAFEEVFAGERGGLEVLVNSKGELQS